MSQKVAYVTGGMGGIGTAICQRLHKDGFKVIAGCGPSRDHAKWLAEQSALGYTFHASVGNVADWDSTVAAFDRAIAEHGKIDVLVNNAGVTKDRMFLKMTRDEWDTVIDTNLAGAFRCARRASKGMIRLRKGRIILISSVVGLYGGPGQANYAASKAGLVGLARSITRELGGRGITANVVAPGFIETDMTAALPEDTQKTYKAAIPAGRFASPEEVAAAVRFLASPEAAYISGAVIPVDGGLGMGH